MIWLLILLPLLGSLIGASFVFFIKNSFSSRLKTTLLGLAGGILGAACFFSLVLPSLEESEGMGTFSFVPCCVGIISGGITLFIMDHYFPHIHNHADHEHHHAERKALLLVAAITLHSIPEGIAIGLQAGSLASSLAYLSFGSAFTLSLAMAIHHVPESAVLAIPLKLDGMPTWRAFGYAMVPGLIVPLAAGITYLFTDIQPVWLPWLMGFAAGAMLYVLVDEIIPQMRGDGHSHLGVLCFLVGFSFMIIMESLFE